MTEFAAALNKQHQDEMRALTSVERIDALERRLAKVEAKLADAHGLWNAAAAAPGALPPAPPADTDPVA